MSCSSVNGRGTSTSNRARAARTVPPVPIIADAGRKRRVRADSSEHPVDEMGDEDMQACGKSKLPLFAASLCHREESLNEAGT